MEKGKTRHFNLLFLEEDEEYLNDILILLKKREKGKMKINTDIKGRLRVCSKSLVFEPYNVDEDVIKIPFKKLEYIHLNNYKNQLIIKTVEIIKIRTIIHNNKTRCITQFVYERENKKIENLFKQEDEKGDYESIKNIDNNNISEKIKIYEQRLNDFSECLFLERQKIETNTHHNHNVETGIFNKSGKTTNSDSTKGGIISTDPDGDLNLNPFMFCFFCENAMGMFKKMKLIYDIVVKIKIAVSIQEKQMEILIKERKNKRELNIYDTSKNGNEVTTGIKADTHVAKDATIGGGSNDQDKGDGKEKEKKKLGGEGEGRKELNVEKYIKNIADELTKNLKFDISSINIHEKIISGKMDGFWVFKLSPLLKIKGILNITDVFIYFQPNPNFTNKKEKKWKISNIVHVFKRIITMKPNALEIIFIKEKKEKEKETEKETEKEKYEKSENEKKEEREKEKKYSSLYIEFNSFNERQIVINVLKKIKPESFFIEDNKNFVYAVQKKWINGHLSNYQYLDFLNSIGGRSRNDFSQYPVFPWILTNYTSSVINLEESENYRDLSKPIGCLNEKRLNSLIEKMVDQQYFYGSHYSTLAYVVHFLIRLYPECQLKLQSGKFDTISRMFLSIESTFNTTLNGNSSFIELIPEFFENDDTFLKNELNIHTCEGNINDVILPNWCKTPKQFLTVMKNALESAYVSEHLHEWVDLIFGYKQKGKPAKDSFNLFHPLTYIHAILNEKMTDGEENENKKEEKNKKKHQEDTFDQQFYKNIKKLILTMPSKALKTQLHEFGQCPLQLFKERHPPKKCLKKNSFENNNWENQNKNALNRERINIPWYYSEVIKQTLQEELLKKKNKETTKYYKRETSKSSDDFMRDKYALDINRQREKEATHLGDTESHVNDDEEEEEAKEEENNGEGYGKSGKEKYQTHSYRKSEKRYDYFKKCKWNLYKNFNFSTNIKSVSNNEENVCFVSNNGYIKILNIFDLLNGNITNNLVSLKITNDQLTCSNSIKENYAFGTSNGNLIIFKPKSVLKKVNKQFSIPTIYDEEKELKQKNGNKKEEGKEGNNHHLFSDISDFNCDKSSSSLFSSADEVFDDLFEVEETYDIDDHLNATKKKSIKKNKKKCSFFGKHYNNNISNKIITKKIHYDTITSLSSYDSFLISGSSDETIQLINIENNYEILQTYDDFDSPVRYVEIKNKLVLTQSDSFKLFDIRKPKKCVISTDIKNISKINGFINSLQLNNSLKHFHNLTNKKNGKYADEKPHSGNKQNLLDSFSPNFQNTLYDEEVIKMKYITPQCLFDKKIKKNNFFFSASGYNSFNNIIYSSLVNDYIIACVDRKTNFYFYDIRNEKWINRINQYNEKKEKKKTEILVAASDKQQLCTVDTNGEIILEEINFWNNTNFYQQRRITGEGKVRRKEENEERTEGDKWKTNSFEKKSSISCSYINFLNYKNEVDALSNVLLLTNRKGSFEILLKEESQI